MGTGHTGHTGHTFDPLDALELWFLQPEAPVRVNNSSPIGRFARQPLTSR